MLVKLKGLGILLSDSKQNRGFSSCCNHINLLVSQEFHDFYKPV